ncbi:MAG: glycosyltransferase family 4 protein [Bacteroidota bacterium]|nr:glycosyltransferase family 4 protein [Bacteroidota bacterium]
MIRGKILALLPDPYWGKGGIAEYNRGVIRGLLAISPDVEIRAVVRRGRGSGETIPDRLTEIPTFNAAGFIARSLVEARAFRPDLLLCAHAHFLPVAAACKRLAGASLCVEAYGIEVWQPSIRLRTKHWADVDECIAISRYTRERLLSWSPLPPWKVHVLPNSIALDGFRPREDRSITRRRLGWEGKRVLLTVGRLSSLERGKGHDRIIGLLPRLEQEFPDILYVICGEGDDIPRLQSLARELGVTHAVRFLSGLGREELVLLYHAADAFAMPSTQEGFGFVYLEAMACGLPVLAGNKDGSIDALRNGEMGILVDPEDPEELYRGLRCVLQRPRCIPEGLKRFSTEMFAAHLRMLIQPFLHSEVS